MALLDVRPTSSTLPAQAARTRAALALGLSHYRIHLVEDHPAVVAAHGPGADVGFGPGLAQARALAREGKKKLDDLDPQAAEVKLRQAADLFEKNVGGLSSSADLIGTYLLLGRVFFATEREVLARDIFRRVVQLQPDLVLDKAVWPPQMISVFEDVKKALLGNPLGSMSVASVPGPALLFVDGRDRGATPADLVNLPSGVHTVTVRRPGYAPWTRPVDVTSFRAEKVTAELALDRYGDLDAVFAPGGLERKDVLGLTVTDYVEGVAGAASLDIVYLGRLARDGAGMRLEVRAFHPKDKVWSEVKAYPLATLPKALDTPAGDLLLEAAHAGWIPSLAARRNIAAGGGALDETARFRLRFSFAPGTRLGPSGQNFPSAPSEGLRVAGDYRAGPRLLLSAETGLDFLSESNAVLTNSSGGVVAPSSAAVQSIYLSVPVDLGGRYYLGVSTLAPFASFGVGTRLDTLTFRDSLPFDTITGSTGLGFGAYLGGGLDYALSTRSGLFFEGRLHTGTVGVSGATVHTSSNPPPPDRHLPVSPGLYTGLRFYLGYLMVF